MNFRNLWKLASMISFLQGQIIAKTNNSLVILTRSGLGYEVRVTSEVFLAAKEGEEAKFFTYFNVREDAQELYGVKTFDELMFFKMLVGVNGVGPRSALHILSLGTVREISGAINRGDLNFLTKVSGIGKKIAERITVELKGKLEGFESGPRRPDSAKLGDVIDALVGLGYSLAEAREAVKQVKETGDASLTLKQALKILNKRS